MASKKTFWAVLCNDRGEISRVTSFPLIYGAQRGPAVRIPSAPPTRHCEPLDQRWRYSGEYRKFDTWTPNLKCPANFEAKKSTDPATRSGPSLRLARRRLPNGEDMQLSMGSEVANVLHTPVHSSGGTRNSDRQGTGPPPAYRKTGLDRRTKAAVLRSDRPSR